MRLLQHHRPNLVARLWTLVPSLAALGFGFYLLFLAGSTLIEALFSFGWQETQGKVVEIRIEELEMSAAAKKRWYEVRLSYVFDAAGHPTKGQRIGFTVEGRQRPDIEKYAATFYLGQEVRVLFSSSNPARSVLERTIGGSTWAMLIGGILLATFGLGFSLASLKRQDKCESALSGNAAEEIDPEGLQATSRPHR
jgi:hypothetical protein